MNHISNEANEANVAFEQFCQKYQPLLKKLSLKIATKTNDAENALQDLLEQGWIAAIHPSFHENGKSRVNFILQRVLWASWRLQSGVSEDYLEDMKGESEISPEDWNNTVPISGSVLPVNTLEYRELIRQMLEKSYQLEDKRGRVIRELLDPSEDFIAFLKKSQKRQNTNPNAATFEFCGSAELYEFTEGRVEYLQEAVSFLKKHFPEVMEL